MSSNEILLLIPSLNYSKWKGLGRYSYYLYNILKKKYNVDVIEVQEPKKNYFKAVFKSFFFGSFFKYKVVHSISPELYFSKFIRNTKKIVTIHDFIPFIDKSIKTSFKTFLLFLYKLNLQNADKIISNSTLTSKLLFKLLKKKSTIINPPVDLKLFKFRKKKPKEKIILSFVSNFSFRKRVDVAIKVCGMLQEKVDCKLILAGGKLERSSQYHFNVIELIKKYNIKDYEIYEEISDKKLVEIYRKSHFFIFPSEMEGFGIPIIEAQACGTPVLVFKNSFLPREVKKMAIKCVSEVDMYKKILELIENEEKYFLIQRKGYEYSKKFSLEIFEEKYIKIYESLL